ncbi:site-specific integrase [Leeuwenhoekiella aequorea]|uniref:site-specific integrase n=1 Tax=Leeuwenhoekiella aequorea TaxID=283736 RepID=UPI00352BEDD4|tara:strand:+ start:213 stop:1421 length:1209 start_codon:yes stop_codon:yes gene_type:complete
MRSKQTFSISFFVRKKKNQPEKALLYTRITINGRSREISLKREVLTDRWNTSGSRMMGSNIESQQINRKVDDVRSKLYQSYDDLKKENQIITIDALKNRFLGNDIKNITLIELLNYHQCKMEKVLKYGTLKNYSTTKKYLIEFLKVELRIDDIYLKQIDYKFILNFEGFLRVKPGLHNNGVMKHMERFKKLMRLALDLDWIDKNPAARFRLNFKSVDMIYLSKSDLKSIEETTFETEKLNLVKDIFLFACYTGLAYVDVKTLTKDHLKIGIDGKKWIFKRRVKTNTPIRIPLLKQADLILQKYSNHIKILDSDILLPVYSNQKINSYLKEIAAELNINKRLSFHAARHTFATTVTLSNGVPIETVSKLLGHHNITTTQIYARVIDSKVSSDIDSLREKLNQL